MSTLAQRRVNLAPPPQITREGVVLWSEHLLSYSEEFLDLVARAIGEADLEYEAVSYTKIDEVPLDEEELEPLAPEEPIVGEASDEWHTRATDEQAAEQRLVSAARGAGPPLIEI